MPAHHILRRCRRVASTAAVLAVTAAAFTAPVDMGRVVQALKRIDFPEIRRATEPPPSRADISPPVDVASARTTARQKPAPPDMYAYADLRSGVQHAAAEFERWWVYKTGEEPGARVHPFKDGPMTPCNVFNSPAAVMELSDYGAWVCDDDGHRTVAVHLPTFQRTAWARSGDVGLWALVSARMSGSVCAAGAFVAGMRTAHSWTLTEIADESTALWTTADDRARFAHGFEHGLEGCRGR